MSSFKRILVVSHNAISESLNNGKTLASLFKNWPPRKFAQLYFNREMPESDRFDKFFRITETDATMSFFLRGLDMSKRCQIAAQIVDCGTVTETGMHSRFKKLVNRSGTAKRLVRDAVYGTSAWFSPSLISWLKEFSPQAVFFVGGDAIFSFKVAEHLCAHFNIPLFLYITDDYVINSRAVGRLNSSYLKRLKERYVFAFGIAEKVFVIGEGMSEAFRKTFGISSIPIMNAVDRPIDSVFSEKYESMPCILKIAYTGGLHLGRDKTILEFGKAMQKVAARTGISVEVRVYSSQYVSTAESRDWERWGVIFCGAAYGEELITILRASDFLLHVESFSAEHIAKTMLSVSTKLPEYMFSGTCIIGYGPFQLSSMRLLKDNNLGITFDESDDERSIVEGIALTLRTPHELRAISDRAYNYAKLNFSGSVVRSRLENAINTTGLTECADRDA